MSEAPKKIWMIEETDWYNHTQEYGDIPYIRADIVDELVEALKNCLEFNGYYFDTEFALAALAKLEESHESN